MKKVVILAGLLVFFGCSKEIEPEIQNNDIKADTLNKILLLKVDLMTNTFEGAKEIILSGSIPATDTLPIVTKYKPPLDFGRLSLYYQPSNELIFDGTIIWMGKGKISYPDSFDTADKFAINEKGIAYPGDSVFQVLHFPFQNEIKFDSIWSAVKNLKIVEEYRKSNKSVGIFIYTPDQGFGDPNNWDWFLLMNGMTIIEP
jgi:hypothetical protein